jgi:hypothetical protein
MIFFWNKQKHNEKVETDGWYSNLYKVIKEDKDFPVLVVFELRSQWQGKDNYAKVSLEITGGILIKENNKF